MLCSVPVWPVYWEQSKYGRNWAEQQNGRAERAKLWINYVSTYIHLNFNILVNNKATTFWSLSSSETVEGVWIISFVLFSSLARAY